MKCSVCTKENKKLYLCQECGSKFCEDCGNLDRERCNLCIQFEETQKNNNTIDT